MGEFSNELTLHLDSERMVVFEIVSRAFQGKGNVHSAFLNSSDVVSLVSLLICVYLYVCV